MLKSKTLKVVKPFSLYKWAKNFKRLQDRFYDNQYKIKRLQDLEDFITLNGYKRIKHIADVSLDMTLPQDANFVDNDPDLTVVTHQGYSRYPCEGIIEQINKWTHESDLYLCLNRHYINIDNKKINLQLPDDYQQAITVWLQKSLPQIKVIDLSTNYIDDGQYYTWVIPDRHYFIRKQ